MTNSQKNTAEKRIWADELSLLPFLPNQMLENVLWDSNRTINKWTSPCIRIQIYIDFYIYIPDIEIFSGNLHKIFTICKVIEDKYIVHCSTNTQHVLMDLTVYRFAISPLSQTFVIASKQNVLSKEVVSRIHTGLLMIKYSSNIAILKMYILPIWAF